MKDAVQCRQCGMCCHKKCVAKCQTSNPCSFDKVSQVKTEPTVSDAVLQPEPCTEDAENNLDEHLKHLNSVSNLSIPGLLRLNSN